MKLWPMIGKSPTQHQNIKAIISFYDKIGKDVNPMCQMIIEMSYPEIK